MFSEHPPANDPHLFEQVIVGDSQMAEMIRSKDWSHTLLGSIGTWQTSLVTTLNTILAVPTPVQIFWGKDLLLFYNDAFVPILQHKHPNSLGSSAREVWAEVWPDIGEQLETVMQEGQSYSYSDLPLELLNKQSRLELRFFTFTYSPIRNSRAEIVGLLNLSQDTTDNVRARRSLQQSERRFRTLVDSASVGIAIGKESGELTYVNPAFESMLGYTQQQVARGELRWDDLTPTRFAEADRRALQQLRRTGVSEPYEKAYFDRNGNAIPLLIGAFVLPADSAFGTGNIAIFAVDLRKQKRTEGMLLQSEKLAAVGKLASSISHEINNPLEAVTNLLYLTRLDGTLSKQSRDYLETADRELSRVSQVASQTLRFHRQSTRPMLVDPKSLLEEVLLLYSARFNNFHVQVHRDYAEQAQLTCYEGDIRQVLNNLVSNAVDSMRATGGCLTVRTRPCRHAANGAPGVLITVADTGCGIPTHARNFVFDAFYTTKGIHGTGLGLWISSRIVHKHRGYIRIRTACETKFHGSVFQLWLPEKLASSAREAWHEDEVSAATPAEDPAELSATT